MKEVVSLVPTQKKVLSGDTSPSKYYGIEDNGLKGFITREDYRNGKFYALCLDTITNGNHFVTNIIYWDSITELIDDFKKTYSTMKFYEFETYPELFSWLAK